MHSRRLARLMGIICDIKANPRRKPAELCRKFSISRRQLYKDRSALESLGFSFHYSRAKGGFVLDKELTFSVRGISLAEVFALMLAVRELTRLSDFSLALGALGGLRRLVEELPDGPREVFSEALERVVVADGFGCDPHVLGTLVEAVREGRRVVIVVGSTQQPKRLSVDPKRLILREGRVLLEAEGIEGPGRGLVALSRIRRVIPTPFYSP